MSLIAALSALQQREGHLGESSLRALAAERNVPLHAVQAVVSFYPHFRTTPPPSVEIGVCRDMACHLAGASALRDRLQADLVDADAEIHAVSCLGRCDVAPAVMINDVAACGAAPGKVTAAARSGDVKALDDHPDRRWPYEAYDEHDTRYACLGRLRGTGFEDVIETLDESGLRGMGGAAFPTGRKWQLVGAAPDPVKYVICNADESEPGTFKDRVLLAERPHLVIEGMTIAGAVIGATRGYVFIRHEYEPQGRRVAAEIDRARADGVLGDGFDIEIFTSPGGYILGEETALLACMEDRRGEPRNKPPFPGQAGLHGKPTLINNVETFAAATAILQRGAAWWRDAGVGESAGLKFISVSGHVRRPDVYQIRMGTTVRQLIDMAGGMIDDRPLKAFAPGGASSNFLAADRADTPIDFDHLAKAGTMLGSGALFVVAEGTDMMELGTNLVRFFRNESCGKCVPCRVGSAKAVDLLDDAIADGAPKHRLDLLQEMAETLNQTSICGLGQVALNPILSVMKHFPDDVAQHVKE